MGASNSSPSSAPTLADLESDESRVLMRNVQMLAARDTAQPGKFTFADFTELHSAMPPTLAKALWRALSRSADGGNAVAADFTSAPQNLDAVVRTIVPLRSNDALAKQAMGTHMLMAFDSDEASAIAAAFDLAVPWLSSVGRASAAAADPRDAVTAAHILADAACAAWLIDLRQQEPLPALTEGSTQLLTDAAHIRLLCRELPAAQRRKWRLLFTTARDGCSFTRFVALTTKRAPCLLVVRDSVGGLFGGFASEALSVSPEFGGGYGSFVYRLSPAPPAVYKASGGNGNLVYLNVNMDELPNGLAFGGNLAARFFGLWLRDDLESGRSDGPCATYGHAPCLASAAEFKVAEIELWAVEEDPPPPSEEEQAAMEGQNALTAAGVLSSKHEETRNFLAMAGRTQHAASLAPLPEAETQDEAKPEKALW